MPHIRTFVHGTVFGQRPEVLERLSVGERLTLVPDPPGASPAVWVHAPGGDVVGHLPDQVAARLAPWMLDGARVGAVVTRIRTEGAESWKRLEVEIEIR